jgi:hypothetical protein
LNQRRVRKKWVNGADELCNPCRELPSVFTTGNFAAV